MSGLGRDTWPSAEFFFLGDALGASKPVCCVRACCRWWWKMGSAFFSFEFVAGVFPCWRMPLAAVGRMATGPPLHVTFCSLHLEGDMVVTKCVCKERVRETDDFLLFTDKAK